MARRGMNPGIHVPGPGEAHPNVITSIEQIIRLLGRMSSPVFKGVSITDLTASRLLYGDANKGIASVTDLTPWVAGTSNRVTVADDGDGTITLSGPQDIHTGASPTFAGLTIDGDPGTLLTVHSEGETANTIIDFECERYLVCNYTVARTTAAATQFITRRSRGTLATPLTVDNEDEIGAFVFQAHDGTSFVNVAGMATNITGEVSTGNVPGSLFFYTNPGAANYISVGKFDSAGYFLANYGVRDDTLTASRLLSSGANKELSSVSDLTAWVAGTVNQVAVANDGDGSITLSTPQNIHTEASPTFSGLTLQTATNPTLLISANSSSAAESGSIEFQSLDVDTGSRIRFVNDESSNNLRVDVRRLGSDSWVSSLYIYRGTVADSGRVGIKIASPQEDLHVADTIRADTAFNLNGTDGLSQTTQNPGVVTSSGGIITAMSANPYGSMYANNIAHTVTVSASDTFYEVDDDITGGTESGMTFQNSKEIKCLTAGNYLVTYSISLNADSVTQKELESDVMLNGTETGKASSHSETGIGAGRPQTNSGTAILTLAVNDVVSIGVANHTDTTDIVIEHLSMTLVKVG